MMYCVSRKYGHMEGHLPPLYLVGHTHTIATRTMMLEYNGHDYVLLSYVQ